jgi:hypothetical protein
MFARFRIQEMQTRSGIVKGATLLRVEDIPSAEMHELLSIATFGHLDCAHDGLPSASV